MNKNQDKVFNKRSINEIIRQMGRNIQTIENKVFLKNDFS